MQPGASPLRPCPDPSGRLQCLHQLQHLRYWQVTTGVAHVSKVVSIRLKDDQVERLHRAARRMGRSPSSAAVVLLEEALRQRDFPLIEFRDSPAGRQAYVRGTRLAVWQVKWLAGSFDGDAGRIAAHLEIPVDRVSEALRYAAVYHDEIDAAIADNALVAEEPERYIPNVKVAKVDAASP